MHSELYTDGVGEISVTGMVVRIDFVSLSPTERDASNQPKSVFRQRVVMSVEGFANSFEVMQKAMQGLIDGGAIKRTAPGVNAARDPSIPSEGGSPEESSGVLRRNGSPNFN